MRHWFRVEILTNVGNDFYHKPYAVPVEGEVEDVMEMEGEAITQAYKDFVEEHGFAVGDDATHYVYHIPTRE